MDLEEGSGGNIENLEIKLKECLHKGWKDANNEMNKKKKRV